MTDKIAPRRTWGALTRRAFLRHALLALGAGAAGGLAACGAPTGAANGPMVEMGALSVFTPSRLTIKAGQTVTWRNTSSIVHSATGDPRRLARPENARNPESVAPWDSGSILAGKSWSRTFDVPGEYRYACVPHEIAGMVGSIVVEPE